MDKIKITNTKKLSLDTSLKNVIQNGSIVDGASGSNFPLNISNVIIDAPNGVTGATAYSSYPLYRLYDDYRIEILGDWTNKIPSGSIVNLRRGSINQQYKIVRTQLLASPTRSLIVFDSSRITPPSLDPFVGSTGYPVGSSQSLVVINSSNEVATEKISLLNSVFLQTEEVDDTKFNLNVSWEIDPEASAVRLRWRSVPRNTLVSSLSFSLDNIGYYYQVPNVTIQSSSGLDAGVQLKGSIYSVSIASGGTGYTSAWAEAEGGGGGTGASFSVGLSGTNVSTITIISGGTGYSSAPNIVIYGDGEGATTENLVMEINSFELLQQGGNYKTAPTVIVDDTYLVGASGATMSSSLVLENTGRIDYVRVSNGGTGYTGASVNISGSLVQNATAEAVVAEDGTISSIVLLTPGIGYTASSVTITPTGTGGTGASAFANIDIYSTWVYESPIFEDVTTQTIYNLDKSVPYELQILVSEDVNFKGLINYSDSYPFSFY